MQIGGGLAAAVAVHFESLQRIDLIEEPMWRKAFHSCKDIVVADMRCFVVVGKNIVIL